MSSCQYAVTIPAEPGALKVVRAFIEAVLAQSKADDPDDIVLALDEACANVVKHRCPTLDDGRIEVSAEVDGEALRLRISRFCRAGEVATIKPRPWDDEHPGGLGAGIVEKVMDRVEYELDPTGGGSVALVLEKKLTKGAAGG